MAEPKVVHSTFVLERSFSKPATAVFAALSEPEKVRQWFADEKTSETLEFSLRFAVGGTRRYMYRLGPSTPVAGMVILNDGYFQDIVPNERIVTATTMTSGDRRLEASLTTFELLPSNGGTDLICTVQGAFFEGLGPDPVGLIRAGWNGLLDKLVTVVNKALICTRPAGDPMMAAVKIDMDRVFHALGDPTRRAILDRLSDRPVSVSNLAAPLGITLTAVMQHLALLEQCGLAHTEKVGRVRTCRIGMEGFDALETWVREHRVDWERRLDRLGELLDEEGGDTG